MAVKRCGPRPEELPTSGTAYSTLADSPNASAARKQVLDELRLTPLDRLIESVTLRRANVDVSRKELDHLPLVVALLIRRAPAPRVYGTALDVAGNHDRSYQRLLSPVVGLKIDA